MLVNYSNGGKKWTAEEYKLLISETSKSSKIDYVKIAEKLNRTKKSVMEKVSKICEGTDSNMVWVNEVLAELNAIRITKLTNNLRKNSVDGEADTVQDLFGKTPVAEAKEETVEPVKANVNIYNDAAVLCLFKDRAEVREKLQHLLVDESRLFILDAKTLKVILND